MRWPIALFYGKNSGHWVRTHACVHTKTNVYNNNNNNNRNKPRSKLHGLGLPAERPSWRCQQHVLSLSCLEIGVKTSKWNEDRWVWNNSGSCRPCLIWSRQLGYSTLIIVSSFPVAVASPGYLTDEVCRCNSFHTIMKILEAAFSSVINCRKKMSDPHIPWNWNKRNRWQMGNHATKKSWST